MDMVIYQELEITLPSSIINEHVGGISEATSTVEYTIPAKFDSVQYLVDHWDTCIDLNEKKYTSQWQTYLKGAQQKKLSRMKIIVATITKKDNGW